MNTYSLTLTIEQINDLLEILWLAGHQREKLPTMNEDSTPFTWLLIALTIAGTILLAIYVHRAPQ
jgi:hypothetical protein